jgi:hypothetical protein
MLPACACLLLPCAASCAARRAEQLEAARGVLSREELELQDVQRQMEEQLVEQFMQVGGWLQHAQIDAVALAFLHIGSSISCSGGSGSSSGRCC